ncbi:para-nitrobenzyl esterase (intracellular esterase B) [Acidisarcina polymorpha]|uniref:Carboxylic ester hydrolase n=2 Tax=Acidisarcina polymorpha TaxID=2211140 RepID=A0A2Z5FSD6_9BACT|nr:para-nitrobenzyl esterase (intracellular esterase B) [Acidisarcina polymorpha]
MQWHETIAPGEPPITHSEDCLYLNIWAPEGNGPFPVFVWIHGGGFVSGHAFEPMYDGTEFARAGIVLITVGYRLGVFGFLDLGPLLDEKAESEYAGSANNALRDIIMALEWVRENVASFGGDPNRVTIGGESAGAKLTDILMGVPSAQPLFHQMISESGGAERIWTAANSATVANGFGEEWRKSSGKDLPSLKTAPASLIIESQHSFLEQWPQHFPLRAEVDGDLIPRLPIQTIAAGSTRGKRLLIGTNRDESALFIGPHPQSDPAAKDLGNLSLAKFEEVLERYKQIYPEMTEEQLRIRAVTAEEYWIPTVRVADAHLQGGGSAWMYQLDFSETNGRLRGYSYHSLDVGLVWNRPHADAENESAEAALAKQVHQAWVAFIRGDTPAAPGLPEWPAYSTTARPTMIFDTQSRIERKPQDAERRLWDGVL